MDISKFAEEIAGTEMKPYQKDILDALVTYGSVIYVGADRQLPPIRRVDPVDYFIGLGKTDPQPTTGIEIQKGRELHDKMLSMDFSELEDRFAGYQLITVDSFTFFDEACFPRPHPQFDQIPRVKREKGQRYHPHRKPQPNRGPTPRKAWT